MKLMIAGSIAIILGIVCFAVFPSDFFSFAAGAVPVLLILTGSLMIYLNYDNVSEKDDTIETPDTRAAFHGNTRTMVFHTPDCRFAKGGKCTAKFTTANEASEKGYKPCGICKPE